MTVRKKITERDRKIGAVFEKYRKELSLKKNSREFFIEDRINFGLLPEDWLSVKSLTNFELGKNFPSYATLKMLAVAYEIEFLDLIKEIERVSSKY